MPALRKLRLAPKLQPFRMKQRRAQSQIADAGRRKVPLISQVVNRDDGFHAAEVGIGTEVLAQIRTQQPARPIVRMKNVGTKNTAPDLQRRLVQQRKANVIVDISGTAVVAIDSGARVKRRAIDKQVAHTFALHFVDRHRERVRTHRQRHGIGDARGPIHAHAVIARHHHRHFLAELHKRRRQCDPGHRPARPFSQTARLPT